MTDLGELGGERRPDLDLAFGYFGERIRVHPDLTDTALVQMFRTMTTFAVSPERSLEIVEMIVATIIDPEDRERFEGTMLANRATIEDLSTLAQRLLEVLTARPTQRPSDSSDGPSTTPTSSAADAYSPALRVLEGRPDLQAAIVMAERQRAVAGSAG